MFLKRDESNEEDPQQPENRSQGEAGDQHDSASEPGGDSPSETLELGKQGFAAMRDLTPAPDWSKEPGEFRVVPEHSGAQSEHSGWYLELRTARSAEKPIRLYVRGDTVLGRGEAADVPLDALNASKKGVSRRHALLRPTPNHLYLIELGSTNGTMLNGLPLAAGMARPLREDDVLTLGELRLTLKLYGDPPAARPRVSVVDLYVPDVLEKRDREARRREPRNLSTGPISPHGENIDYGD